jgi:hypothetical protein
MENLSLNDIGLTGSYVTIWLSDGRGLLVSYPSPQIADRAYYFLVRIYRTFAADGEARRSPKALAYVYGREMTVLEFVRTYQNVVEGVRLHTEWITDGRSMSEEATD